MNKCFGCLIALTLNLFAVNASDAQQSTRIPRVGFVSGSGDPSSPGFQVKAFKQGLIDLGYFEGKNVLVEYRYGQLEGRETNWPNTFTGISLAGR